MAFLCYIMIWIFAECRNAPLNQRKEAESALIQSLSKAMCTAAGTKQHNDRISWLMLQRQWPLDVLTFTPDLGG